MPPPARPTPVVTAVSLVATALLFAGWFVFQFSYWVLLGGMAVVAVGLNLFVTVWQKRTGPSPERAAATSAVAPAESPTVVPPDRSAPDLGPGRRLHRIADDGGGPALLVAFAVGFALFAFAIYPAAAKPGADPTTQVAFVVVAVLLLGFAYRNGGRVFAVVFGGRVAVEVDAHPFAPGGTYRGRVELSGRVSGAVVELACEEVATYQAGTTESTARHVAARVPVDGTPADFTVTVPAGAMHSFAAANNKLTWSVRVTGRVLGVLPYAEAFEVVVTPGAGDGG
jgi:hypothetical protein